MVGIILQWYYTEEKGFFINKPIHVEMRNLGTAAAYWCQNERRNAVPQHISCPGHQRV